MRINKKLLEWLLIVGVPACAILIYVSVASRTGIQSSAPKVLTIIALTTLPGIYGITLSVRGFRPRVAAIVGYIVAIVVIFILSGIVYSCDVLKDCF